MAKVAAVYKHYSALLSLGVPKYVNLTRGES